MPRVTRRREITAPVSDVWRLVADPYNLPRWWPRVTRVENVIGGSGSRRGRWTMVLGTKAGRGVRADFRLTSSAENDRRIWEQDVVDTPFEKHMKSSETEIALREQGTTTAVSLTSRQSLRGLSRLGGPLVRRATGQMLGDALDGIEAAVGETGETEPSETEREVRE